MLFIKVLEQVHINHCNKEVLILPKVGTRHKEPTLHKVPTLHKEPTLHKVPTLPKELLLVTLTSPLPTLVPQQKDIQPSNLLSTQICDQMNINCDQNYPYTICNGLYSCRNCTVFL